MRNFLNVFHRFIIYFTYTNTYLPKRAKYTIGKYSYGVPTVFNFTNKYKLTIGNYCSISENVTIFLDGDHRTDWVSMYPPRGFSVSHNKYMNNLPEGHSRSKGDVIIGNDVWIAYGVTILSGVEIGDGAVLGACSVVAKDIPPYAIVVGNPSNIIKYRFSPEIIRKLLKIQWWNWSKEKIQRNIYKLLSPDVEKFINEFYQN